jgi:hypothetical protein
VCNDKRTKTVSFVFREEVQQFSFLKKKFSDSIAQIMKVPLFRNIRLGNDMVKELFLIVATGFLRYPLPPMPNPVLPMPELDLPMPSPLKCHLDPQRRHRRAAMPWSRADAICHRRQASPRRRGDEFWSKTAPGIAAPMPTLILQMASPLPPLPSSISSDGIHNIHMPSTDSAMPENAIFDH